MAAPLILLAGFIVALWLAVRLKKKSSANISPMRAVGGLFAIILGSSLVFFQQTEIESDLLKRNWPKVKGEIIESRVSGSRAVHPEIKVRYLVDSTDYEILTDLATPGFGSKRSRRDTAEEIISEYGRGKSVMITYNPEDPREGYIRTGPYWTNYLQFAFGSILFAIGIYLLSSIFINKFFTQAGED